MKPIVIAVVVLVTSLNVATANAGTKSNQLEDASIRIIREWK